MYFYSILYYRNYHDIHGIFNLVNEFLVVWAIVNKTEFLISYNSLNDK